MLDTITAPATMPATITGLAAMPKGRKSTEKEGLPPLRLGAAEAVPEKKGWMDHSSLVSPTKRATMWNPARL